MTAYSKNITGYDSFWYQRHNELRAICEQKKVLTIFYSFSCGDTYWYDLHRLMPAPAMEKKKRFINCLENAHLVDWYFSYKLNTFSRVFFDDILKCEWRYHRIEDQYRLVAHAHGTARLKNDPGLMDMALIVYESRLIEKKCNELNKISDEEQKIISNGKLVEKKMTTYMDTLVTATISLHYDNYLVSLICKNNKNEKLYRKTLIHYYAERKDNLEIKPYHNISLIEFAAIFKLSNSKLIKIENPNEIVIITIPQINYYPKDTKKYIEYCYFQYIKYAEWDKNTINKLNNLNIVEKWENYKW